jgi:GT2 family glycosyltransferase
MKLTATPLTLHIATCILNYNGLHWLQQFLPTLLLTTYPQHQLVIIDNASTDGSKEWTISHYPQIQWVELAVNAGYAGGYNQGLKQVKADVFVLLNNDVSVTPNWLEPIAEMFVQNPNIAAIQPKILDFKNPNSFEYAGASGGFIDKLGYPFCRGRIFNTLEENKEQYQTPMPIMWATGACFCVRASAYQQAGGLDELFFAHMEEIDFCWRLQRLGYQIWAQPKSTVYHVGGGTLPTGNANKVYLNFRNNLYMLYKNLPISKSIWVLIQRFIWDEAAAFKELCTGNPAYWLAVQKAWWHFITLKKSKLLQVNAPKSWPAQGKYNKSILWQYFIKGRKTFKALNQQGFTK